MALVTGTPLGVVTSQAEVYIEGAPNIYYSSTLGAYAKNPDSDNFYWGLSGSATYPVYQLGCYENVALGDNQDINSVRCDTVGDKDVIMKRNHLEVKFTLKSFLPFTNIQPLLNGGPVTTNLSEHTEKFGLGVIDNSKYYRVYLPKVYDETAGDYVSITVHRGKFVGGGELSMSYGNVWSMPVTLWGLADEAKPSAQQFATVIRADLSAI